MKNNYEMLMSQVISGSNSKEWNSAIMEWEITDFSEDADMQATCKCGKEHIKYLYTIENRMTGSILEPIGSSCITKFGRKDMKEQTNVYEQLFRLVNAKREGAWIEIKSDDKYFSNKLLDYLLKQKALTFSTHETLKKFFNMRKAMTYKQKKYASYLIIKEVFPYLDAEISKRVKPKGNVVPKEYGEINKLIEMREDGKFINEDTFNLKMVEELNQANVFSTYQYKGKTYNNYETFKSLIKANYKLTFKQSKLLKNILMRDIIVYLDKQIKVK